MPDTHLPVRAPSTRDARLDVFRGMCLVMIFINHVPGNPYERFTSRNFGWSDAAEAFVMMSGIAAGYSKAGVPTTLDEIIGWNAYMEMTGYWWPTVASQYVNDAPNGNRKSHCSAFIATGSATADGRIVIGHEAFTEFWKARG